MTPELIFSPTPIKGVYAVTVVPIRGRSRRAPLAEVIGTVERCPLNPNVWNANSLRGAFVAQRSTRQLAGLALTRKES